MSNVITDCKTKDRLESDFVSDSEDPKTPIMLSKSMFTTPSDSPTIDYNDDIIIESDIGAGVFGNVLCAKINSKYEGKQIALKRMEIHKIQRRNLMQQINREIYIHKLLDHPNIAKFIDYFYDAKTVYIVLEYIPAGDLYNILKDTSQRKFHISYVQKYTKDIINVIEYCHSLDIIHRDLKLDNILLSTSFPPDKFDRSLTINEQNDDSIKLIDFGYAAILRPRKKTRSSLCGTLDYLSPEIVNYNEYDYSVDIWSIGVTMYEMITGIAPFLASTYSKTYTRIKTVDLIFDPIVWKKDILPARSELSHKYVEAQDIICKILVATPSNRLTLTQMLSHSFFSL